MAQEVTPMQKLLLTLALTTLLASVSSAALTAKKRAEYLRGVPTAEATEYNRLIHAPGKGQDEADKYLATRFFFAQCAKVRDGSLPAIDLPPFPAENYGKDYLNPDEKLVVIASLQASNDALDALCRNPNAPRPV